MLIADVQVAPVVAAASGRRRRSRTREHRDRFLRRRYRGHLDPDCSTITCLAL